MAATAPATDPPDALPAVTADAPTPARPTPAELVARAIAPVKPAFLRPPPVREAPKEEGGGGAVVKVEKKSKRQLKRERHQVTTAVPWRRVFALLLPQRVIGLCLLGACCNVSADQCDCFTFRRYLRRAVTCS
jgi:hypothetical protein